MTADKMAARGGHGKVDVIDLIDRHPVTGFQIGVLILCMLVAALDGFDTQAIGYTAPAIAAVIHLPMPQFGQVGSAGLVGAALGALSFGPLADLFGRKWFMIIAMIVFAVFSYLHGAIDLAQRVADLSLLCRSRPRRRDAGLPGDGRGAGAEAAARRVRHRAVRVLSGRRADRLADQRLGHSRLRLANRCSISARWRRSSSPSFLRSGFPKSIRFLLARGIRQDEVRRTLERIMPGAVPAGAELVAPPDPARQGVPVKHLFRKAAPSRPCCLWVPFFMVFMVLVTVTFWTPGGAQFGRLLALRRGLDHRPEQSRQRHRQRHVGLGGASWRRVPRAHSGLHSRRPFV